MAYTIFKKSATKWVKQPNRIVKTFPSGLCMIQQDYIAARVDVDYFAFNEGDALLLEDSAPCIDSAYIFPTPEYQDMGNGFIKCTVVAYGRTNTTGSVNISKNLGSVVYYRFDPNRGDYATITISNIFSESLTKKVVLAAGEEITTDNIELLQISGFSSELVQIAVSSNDDFIFTYTTTNTLQNQITRYEETDFGRFKEVTVIIEPKYSPSFQVTEIAR
jgi:hypothetical protein